MAMKEGDFMIVILWDSGFGHRFAQLTIDWYVNDEMTGISL